MHQDEGLQHDEEVCSFLLFPPTSFHSLTFNLHCNFNLQEEEEARDEDEEQGTGPGGTTSLWVRGGAGLPKPPRTEAEKLRIRPTNRLSPDHKKSLWAN